VYFFLQSLIADQDSSLLAEMVAEYSTPKHKPSIPKPEKFDLTLLENDEDLALDAKRFDELDFQCKILFISLCHCQVLHIVIDNTY
jgi:hypothetical protein